jgi:hypothetical protein
MVVLSEMFELLSRQYRSRAKECRRKAESLRNPKARTRMLTLSEEYDNKANQAELYEAETKRKTIKRANERAARMTAARVKRR